MAFDFGSIADSFKGLLTTYQGGQIAQQGAEFESDMAIAGSDFAAQLALDGGAIDASFALQGSKIAADGYRRASVSTLAIANYNIAVDQLNSARQRDGFARQIESMYSSNRAISGSSGLAMSSKSFLAVAHSNLSDLEKMYSQMRTDEKMRQNQIGWAANNQAVELENKARVTEYQGSANAIAANYRAASEAAALRYQGQQQSAAAQYRGSIGTYQAQQGMFDNIGTMMGNLTNMFGG